MDDPILPIDQASRDLVPELRELGYPVTYREFDGKHEVPDEVVPEALTWLGVKPRTTAG